MVLSDIARQTIYKCRDYEYQDATGCYQDIKKGESYVKEPFRPGLFWQPVHHHGLLLVPSVRTLFVIRYFNSLY